MVKNEKSSVAQEKLGYYQKRLLILLMLSSVPNCFASLQFLIIQFTPDHHCDVRGLGDSNVTSKETNLNASIPFVMENEVMVRSSCLMFNSSAPGTNNTVQCEAYQYEGIETSIITEFNLVCGKKWKQPMLLTSYFVGKLFGGLTGGILSDRFGRRPIFLIFTLWHFLSAIFLSFTTNIYTYAFMLFISGCGTLVNFVAAILIGYETISSERRTLVYSAVEMGYGIGYMILPLIGFYFRHWRWYLRFTGLLGIVYIPYYWYIDESIYWLVGTGKPERAQKIRNKIAVTNGEAIRDRDVKDHDAAEFEGLNIWTSIREMTKHWTLLYRLFIFQFAWFVCSMTYYTIALNTNSLSGDRFLNMLYAGITEVVSAILYYIWSEAWGRRRAYVGTMIITAVSVASAPLFVLWSPTLVTITTMFSKLAVSLCYNIIYGYTGEVFPTATRQTVLGISASSARIGSMISPYIIYASNTTSTFAPCIATAALNLISALLALLLPTTRNKALPSTVHEALLLKSECTLSCCSGGKDKNEKPLDVDKEHKIGVSTESQTML
nr:solute carrier family 22 member 5-like isoform X1 [Ciona intestinalis]|eukprot:XP_002119673.3 solute carrier family 22 member 5-like isoform X1 [Ciona intestinalis]